MATEWAVELLPLRQDNYAYVITWAEGQAAVVDPADAAPVQAALDAAGLTLTHILVTHYHNDHTGGCRELKAATGCVVIGPDDDRVPALDRAVAEGDVVALGAGALEVVDVAGHTRPHIAYYAAAMAALWSGDSLFAGGCGRLFEGSAADMLRAMTKLAELPDATRVYCGHEYTTTNLRFAASLEPDNAAVATRLREAGAARRAGRPTVPSTIGEERRTNPFLRAAELASAIGMADGLEADVFAEIRRRKDRFS